MDFHKGERVRCLGRPDWGAGLVLEESTAGKVWVRFERAGTKLLIIRYAKLLKVRLDPCPSGTRTRPATAARPGD